MNLGFYYHLEAAADPRDGVRVPRHLGVFVESLARSAGSVVFYGHIGAATGAEDHLLDRSLVRFVDLGPLRSFPSRTFRPGPAIRRFRPADHAVDVMFVLGPTPLLPALARHARTLPVVIMLWADYSMWRPQAHFPWWRNQLIRLWTKVYDSQQRRASREKLVFLQNPALRDAIDASSTPEVVFVPSLTESDARSFSSVEGDTARQPGPVRLLFVGRIVAEKGVVECVEALPLLRSRGIDATLSFVGAEEPGSNITDLIRSVARRLAVEDQVSFLGYRSGRDLIATYADADIFVLPSYWEGMPRALHEAMAFGLPVVTTNVGGMRYYLESRRNAILVPPRSTQAVADAIAEIVSNPDLRERVIREGRRWASAHTVERSCAAMIGAIERTFDVRSERPSAKR